MHVRLQQPDIEQFIADQVETGRFPTAEAVVQDALMRMMEEEISLTAEDITAIQESERQIELGKGIELAEFASRIRQKYGIRH